MRAEPRQPARQRHRADRQPRDRQAEEARCAGIASERAQLKTDHAPEMYRMDTVRNLDAWYPAFDVKEKDSLFLKPADRVRIW